MAVADITKSVVALTEDFFGIAGGSPAIKDIIKVSGVASTNPADFTALANASAITTATVAAAGAAVGDIVLGWGVVSGLAANQYVIGAYVSASDVVTLLIANAVNTTVVTTAVTVNLLIADVT